MGLNIDKDKHETFRSKFTFCLSENNEKNQLPWPDQCTATRSKGSLCSLWLNTAHFLSVPLLSPHSPPQQTQTALFLSLSSRSLSCFVEVSVAVMPGFITTHCTSKWGFYHFMPCCTSHLGTSSVQTALKLKQSLASAFLHHGAFKIKCNKSETWGHELPSCSVPARCSLLLLSIPVPTFCPITYAGCRMISSKVYGTRGAFGCD